MSAVQAACIAHRNGESNGFDDLLENIIDANGDPVKADDESKAASSSEEDVASCNSKDEESDEFIHLKTR